MKNDVHYNKINDNFSKFSFGYDVGVSMFGLSEKSKIRYESINELQIKPGEIIFDVCCGTGLNFKLLEEKIKSEGQIVGIDLTVKMLNIATERSKKNSWDNITILNNNILYLESNKVADKAICTAAMGMIPEYEKAIDVIMDNIKEGGLFGIVDVKLAEHFPMKILNNLFLGMSKNAGFDIKSRNLLKYIRSKYITVYYKEYFGGFVYTIIIKK
jgi:ubiquinone/menaquinone biosynthesis C-methylase UbiE